MTPLHADFTTVALAWIAGAVMIVPLTGLTARWGLRPLVDAVARMRRAGDGAETDELEARVDALTAEVARLAARVNR